MDLGKKLPKEVVSFQERTNATAQCQEQELTMSQPTESLLPCEGLIWAHMVWNSCSAYSVCACCYIVRTHE